MTGSEIRQKFLDYFAVRWHRVVRSSSLVPANDPTLLFTNAGMNQFKDVFLGREHRDYTKAASSQKCMRAGGKHNDLENVGRTRRHHTFFEMLGNFSFGDYFKPEAIEFAWELITKEFALPLQNLYVTVFRDDYEAEELWKERIGVPADRVVRRGEEDNFWAMGETGPCGPCSEIHYDLGPAASDLGHTDCQFPCECGRYVEIWNLVFMQFNRDATGALTPLPRPCVDTGMGLERVAAVVQGKVSNFETDLLWPLVEAGAELAGVSYGEKPAVDVSLRILADHSRAAAFLIHDGILPANDGRGYVLRKVLRRAARHGKMLGLDHPFLYLLTGKVVEIMSDAYPELLETTERVAAVVKSEEQRFAHTMTVALQEFDKVVKDITITPEPVRADWRVPAPRVVNLPGDKLFRLYDTFGMPLDWINEIAGERGLSVDEAGFNEEMQRQRERARASWKGAGKEVLAPAYAEVLKKGRTGFEGYQQTASHDCTVLALVRESVLVAELPAGARAELVLDHTPFYAEAGGQVGDAGVLLDEQTQEVIAIVEDTYSPVSGVITHRITSRSPIRVGERLTAVVDAEKRRAAMRNHTGTHLLHAALRQVLGGHVKQAGSVVEPARLRFDFSHFASVGADELEEIERLANAAIVRNAPVETEVLELDQALESGALAFFGEKYPERVRVVTVPEFSKELCGGTHVSRTGDIGLLKVTSEGSISAGVRRIEAVTGARALEQFQAVTSVVHQMAAALKTSPAELPETVEKLVEAQRQLEKQVESLQFKMAQAQLADVEQQVRSVGPDCDVRVLSLRFEALDRAQMRQMADLLRQRLRSGVVVLATAADGKVALIAALTPDLTKRLHAGKIAQAVAKRLGGTGGGRADIAEAGGKNVNLLDSVLNEVYDIVGEML
ncbi:MAG: alanine--tRNA ligase [Acidobacteria bacterium RIFCSPLOWO2_12_FULL_60_22]|nr:MAG: alanine--tRNA ligase [Acidobacteria bacterium RIFCSPLOWO2_12_FULL_60_22]